MVDVVTDSPVTDLVDRKLRAIASRVVRTAELGIEKVAANHQNPSKFPLPSQAESLEQILAGRFRTLPEVTKKFGAMNALEAIQKPAAVRQKQFKDLAKVDLTKATPVETQAKALPLPDDLKVPKDHLKNLSKLHGQILDPGLAPQQTTNKLELRIHKVKCLDETGSGIFGNLGSDEIDLGGTSVDESGDTKKIPPFRVGSDFDTGEQKPFSPPRRFTFFNLTEGTAFPKSYFVTLVLAEIDMGGLPEFVSKLLDKVRDEVISALKAAGLGAAIGASGGVFGAVIGAAVGFVVVKVFELFKSVWNDDVFKPVTVSVSIPSLGARWPGGATNSPDRAVTFNGHGGEYQLVYDWRMFA